VDQRFSREPEAEAAAGESPRRGGLQAERDDEGHAGLPPARDGLSEARAGQVPDAAAAREESADQSPARTFRDNRIHLSDLNLPLRLFIYLLFAQTAVVAVLLLTQNAGQPQVGSGVLDQRGGMYAVPLASFLVMAISIAAGYCLVLTGAVRIRAAAGLPIIAAATAALAFVPVSWLREGGPDTGQHGTEVWLRWAQLGVLALLAAWALWDAAAKYRSPRPASSVKPDKPRWHGMTFAGMSAIVVAYYTLEFAVWGSYAGAGQTTAGTAYLRDDLSFQAVLLPIFLTLILLMGSTDLLGWGQVTAQWATRQLNEWLSKRVHVRVLWVVTPLVGLAMVADVVQRAPGAVPLELAAGGLFAVIVIVLARSGAGYATWSDEMRSRAVLFGSIAIFVFTTVLSNIASGTGNLFGLRALDDNQVYALVSLPVLLVLLTGGIYLLIGGRPGKPKQMTMTMFLVTAGLLALVATLQAFLRTSNLPSFPPDFLLLSAVQLAAALGVLGWAGWLLTRKRDRRVTRQAPGRADKPVIGAFLLLVGLALVSLVTWVLREITKLGADSGFLLAGLFLLAGFWGLITAGDTLNQNTADTARYPRDGRIILFAGYTLFGNATLLYLGTLHLPGTSIAATEILTTDYVTPAGVGILGTAVVVMAFVLGPARHRPASQAQGERTISPRNVRLSVAGAGAALAALVVVFVSVSAWPLQVKANSEALSQSYQASVPGPECDTNANVASWSVPPGAPVSTRCLPDGLRVVAAPGGSGDVQFLPPSGTFPRNYSVSVRVNLAGLDNGCVSIATRASADGYYRTYLCANGPAQARTWEIKRISASGSQWLLAIGALGTSDTYTLQASAENSEQQIAIDNAQSSGTDATFTATKYIALGISNSGTRAASVVLSDFRFTPLPAHPAPCCAGMTALPVTTRDRVVVWLNNVGDAELSLLIARIKGAELGHGLAAQLRACSELAATVTAARGNPPIPDTAAQGFLAGALTAFGKYASDCQAGAGASNKARLGQALASFRAGSVDLAGMDAAIKDD
jgi:hypothetical protein